MQSYSKRSEFRLTNLFQYGKFISHSGKELLYKIECDAFTYDDWDCLAQIVASKINYEQAWSIPRGGDKFADALNRCDRDIETTDVLLVDDVWTTGRSFNEYLVKECGFEPYISMSEWCAVSGIIPVVAFARRRAPSCVKVIFQVSSFFDDEAR